MKKKILITGGSVHGKIDAVKIVTNHFRGGRMASLASRLEEANFEITYLCVKGSIEPKNLSDSSKVLYHDGIYDYMDQVKELSKTHDIVILGAAVANLIPVTTLEGKFPSHDYSPGDIIPINFQIAPRIVDEVKKSNPNVMLFAFKLLSNVDQETLVNAAYDIVIDSKATAVFANDMSDLNDKYAITKERSIIPLKESNYHEFIIDCINDKYFRTEIVDTKISEENINKFHNLVNTFKNDFKNVGEYIFGTIALRVEGGFLTTIRGKDELSGISFVSNVDFENRVIQSNRKASLNAPLLYKIFQDNLDCNLIVHSHEQDENFKTLDYAIPGTLKDSNRMIDDNFNIEYHGSFRLIK